MEAIEAYRNDTAENISGDQERNQMYNVIKEMMNQNQPKKPKEVNEAINQYCDSEDINDANKAILQKETNSSVISKIIKKAIDANDPEAAIALYPYCSKEPIRNDENSEKYSTFGYALLKGSLESAVAFLLSEGGLNQRFFKDQTALHGAVQAGSYGFVQYLIETISVNDKDRCGNTALHVAAKSSSSSSVVNLLLEAGLSPIEKNDSGFTPLHKAASAGNKEFLSKIIGNDRSLMELKSNNGTTILACAFIGLEKKYHSEILDPVSNDYMNGYIDIIQYLIELGSDVNISFEIDETKHTPYEVALYVKSTKLIKMVIDAGVTLEADSLATLWRGSMESYFVNAMFAARLSNRITETDDDGALEIAMPTMGEKLEIMERDLIEASMFLISAGADINKGDQKNRTPIMYAIIFNLYDGVKFLVEAGANLNAKDKKGNTITHFLAIHNNEKIKALVGEAAFIEELNDKGQTAEKFAESFLNKIQKNSGIAALSCLGQCLLI